MMGGPFAHFCVPECVSPQVRVQFSNGEMKGDVVADNESGTGDASARDQRGASRPNRGNSHRNSSSDRNSSDRSGVGRTGSRSAPRRDSGPRGQGSERRDGGSRDPRDRRSDGTARPASDRRAGAPSRGPRDGGFKGDREPRAPRRERDGGEATPRPRIDVPDVPEDVTGQDLDRDVHGRLRTLSKENAEDVARHLVMAGRMLDEDPERAYRHAQVALARGGRVDVVREAAALTAYATGRYAEALREFRAVTRLSGSHAHLALVADCERGLGRPEKALEVANSPEAKKLDHVNTAELELVVAGARSDLQQYDAALLILDRIKPADGSQAERVLEARTMIRQAAGFEDGAAPDPASSVGEPAPQPAVDDDDVVVYDLEDDVDA
jgi:hypothetical protein